ncbi:MRGRH protein, partial [Brachypteracias leptosomus]|nr:MRGRH protein [Brachypteracias leptosomus]
ETVTTELFVSYMASGDVNAGQYIKYHCPSLPASDLVFAGVYMGISVCGLVGNGIVVWFLGFQMKRTPFTVYILNLAIADFLLLLLLLARAIFVIIVTVYCIFSDELVSANRALALVFHFWYFASMYLLAAISVERCLSVL